MNSPPSWTPWASQALNSSSSWARRRRPVENSVVVVGAEKARLNRIKHSDRLPSDATRLCLEEHGICAAKTIHLRHL
jgi:hypothetical protein